MKEVLIFSSNWCPYCTRAKELLKQKGVAFNEVNVDNVPGMREKLAAETGMKTIPQIFIDAKFIGGFQQLSELDAAGKLDVLLK